jgi:4-hydroxybenzoate polyprenyltransferase
VVGRRISRSKAIMLHLILSGLGILLFFVFAWLIQQFILGILGLLAVGLIWFYSKQYKYQLLIGNIVLALLAVSPFFLVTMTEPSFMEQLTGSNTYVAFNAIRIFLMYALFVFLLSFVLSIIKDIEDMDGDKLMQGTTLPLSIGLKQSLLVVAFVLLMLMGIMVYVLNLMYSGGALIQLGYTVTLLFIPLLLAFILCFTSTNLSEVSKIKRILTLLVYSGILSIPVVYYF